MFPSVFIVPRADRIVILQIGPSIHYVLPYVPATQTVLYGMKAIVDGMKNSGGDAPIPSSGLSVSAPPAFLWLRINVAQRLTFTLAEATLRGVWELWALYGFSNVQINVFIDALTVGNHIGSVAVGLLQANGTKVDISSVIWNGSVVSAAPTLVDTAR